MNALNNFIANQIQNQLEQFFEISDAKLQNDMRWVNCKIRHDKLNEMLYKMPFIVNDGSQVGKIIINLKLSQIWNSPLKITLENMRIYAQVRNSNEPYQLQKDKVIGEMLNEIKNFVQTETEKQSGFFSAMGIQGIIERIVDNLQIEIKDFKLILDSPGVSENPHLILSFDKFYFKTVDDDGNEIFYDRTNPENQNIPVKKFITIQKLSLQILPGSKYQEMQDIKQKENKQDYKKIFQIEKESQIFSISIDINGAIKTDPSQIKEPKYNFDIQFKNFTFVLKQDQIIFLLKIQNEITTFFKIYNDLLQYQLPKPTQDMTTILKEYKEEKQKLKEMYKFEKKFKKHKIDRLKEVKIRRWYVYYMIQKIRENAMLKCERIVRNEYNIEKLIKERLPLYLVEKFKTIIKNNLHYLNEKDFKDTSILKDDDQTFDLYFIFSCLTTQQIIQLIKNNCQSELERIRQFNKSKSKIQKVLEFLHIISPEDKDAAKKEIEEKLKQEDMNFESNNILQLTMTFEQMQFNFVSNQATIYRFKLETIDLLVKLKENKMFVEYNFDQIGLYIIKEIHGKKQNQQIMGGDENQKFLQLKLQKEEIDNYSAININLEIRGQFLTMKESLFVEFKDVFKSFTEIQNAANVDVASLKTNMNQTLTQQVSAQQKKPQVISAFANLHDCKYTIEFNQGKSAQIYITQVNLVYQKRMNLQDDSDKLKANFDKIEVLYFMRKNEQPYQFFTMSVLIDYDKYRNKQKKKYFNTQNQIRQQNKKQQSDFFSDIIIYAKNIAFDYYPIAVIDLKKNIDDFLDHKDIILQNTIYFQEVLKFTTNYQEDINIQWDRSVLTMFSSKKITIGTIDNHYNFLTDDLYITYINLEHSYLLKLQNKMDLNQTFYFQFFELNTIKKFAESVIYLNPELSKEDHVLKKSSVDDEDSIIQEQEDINDKNQNKVLMNIKFFCFSIFLNLHDDLGDEIYKMVFHNLLVEYGQKISLALDHLIIQDLSVTNQCKQNLLLHLGKFEDMGEAFYKLKNQNLPEYQKAYETFIQQRDQALDQSFLINNEDSIKQLSQSFFSKAIFNIKNKVGTFIQNQSIRQSKNLKDRLIEDQNAYSFNLDVDNDFKNIKIKSHRILLNWNAQSLHKIQKYIMENKAVVLNYLLTVNKNDDQNNKEKSENQKNSNLKIDNNLELNNSIQQLDQKSQKKVDKIAADIVSEKNNNKKDSNDNKIDDKQNNQVLIQSQIDININQIILFNTNKSAYQTELIMDKINLKYLTLKDRQQISLNLVRLQINDLTNYPFTKKTFELFDIKKVNRKRLIDINTKVPNIIKIKNMQGNNNLRKQFEKYCILVEVEILNPEIVNKKTRAKTKAFVKIHNVKLNYYQQLIFRLIDWITCSILPFVMPDNFPKDRNAIKKRIDEFYKTFYKVDVYSLQVFLKPNNLSEKYLKLEVPYIKVGNLYEYQERNYSPQNKEPFLTESININVHKPLMYGYNKKDQMLLSQELKVTFNRFLFFQELNALRGIEYMLNAINFGNKIIIKTPKLQLSMFKNDFFFFMTCLFNNITYNDQMDKRFMSGYQDLGYSAPMIIDVSIDDLLLDFKQNINTDQPKHYLFYLLPDFRFYMYSDTKWNSTMRLTIDELRAMGIKYKDRLISNSNTISFIAPLDDLIHEKNCMTQTNNNNIIIDKFKNFQENTNKKSQIHFKTTNCCQKRQDFKGISKFCFEMKMDSKGNKDIQIDVQSIELTLIPPLINQIIMHTQMVNEMSMNNLIKPFRNTNYPNMYVSISLVNTYIKIPNNENSFNNILYLYIEKMKFFMAGINHQYSQQILDRINKFKMLEYYGFQIKRDQVLQSKDDYLNTLAKSYQLDKFIVNENQMIVELEGVDLFVIENNNIQDIIEEIPQMKIKTNFSTKQFQSQKKIKNNTIRYIMNDLKLKYQNNYLSNSVFKDIVCSEGNIEIQNLQIALSMYDILYLQNFTIFTSQYGFENVKLENNAQLYINDIIKNNSNHFKDNQIQYKNRRILQIKPFETQLMITDDIWESGDPLINLKLFVKNLVILDTYKKSFINLILDLNCDYFNTRIQVWEPVLENWHINLDKSFSFSKEEDILNLYLKNSNPCLNISTDFLYILQSFLSYQTVLSEKQIKNVMVKRADFFIRNHTGYSLDVILIYDDKQYIKFEVVDNEEFKVEEIVKKNSIDIKKVQEIGVSLVRNGTKINLMRSLFQKHLLNRNLQIKDPQDKENLTVLNFNTQFTQENAQKIFSINSTYRIENCTGVDLYIRFCNLGKTKNLELKKGSSQSVPLDFLDGAFQFKVIDEKIAQNRKKYSKMYCFSYKQNIKELDIQKQLYFYVKRTTENQNLIKLKINPTFTIKNYLMNDMLINIVPLNNNIKLDLLFQKESFIQNVFIAGQCDVEMTVNFIGLKSKPFVIKKKELEQNFYKKIWLHNEKQIKTMKIYIKSINNSDSFKTIFFYHKSILICEMFENWLFQQNLKGQNILLNKIAGKSGIEPEVYQLKHNKDLIIRSMDADILKTSVSTGSVGSHEYNVQYNSDILKQLTVNIYMQNICNELDDIQKVVKILPKQVFINNTNQNITIEHINSGILTNFAPKQRKAVTIHNKKPIDYKFKIKSSKSKYSESIDFSQQGYKNFSLPEIQQQKIENFKIETNLLNNTYYIILHKRNQGVLNIINKIEGINVLIYQDQEMSKTFDYDFEIQSLEQKSCSWRYPDKQNDKITLQFIDQKSRVLIGQTFITLLQNKEKKEVILLDKTVYIELEFKEFYGDIYIYEIGKEFEKDQKKSPYKCNRKITIPNLGLSVITGKDQLRKELFYLHLTNLQVEQQVNKLDTEYGVKLQYLQIDYNAKNFTTFPVLFCQKISKEQMIMRGQSYIALYAKLNNPDSQEKITVIKSLGLRILGNKIQLDSNAITHIQEFIEEYYNDQKTISQFMEKKHNKQIEIQKPDQVLNKHWKNNKIESLRPTYIEQAIISKIPLRVSIRIKNQSSQQLNIVKFYGPIVKAVLTMLANLDNVHISLPKYKLHNNVSLPVFQQQVISHYSSSGNLAKYAFNAVGSMNIIGNPSNLVHEMKTGVKTLVNDTRTKGAKGVITGTGSLAKHTVSGALTSVNKVTRTVGDGISSITLDQNYLKKREKLFAKRQNKFLTGLQQFGIGIKDGVTGLFTKPYKGAQKQGFKGAMKGTAKGITGLVLKPITGTLDLTSATFQGFKNLISDQKNENEYQRQRDPRTFYTDLRYYKNYDKDQAHINSIIPRTTKEGFNLVLIEKVDCELNTLIICLEGIFLISNDKIEERIDVQNLIGCLSENLLITIEYFIFDQNKKEVVLKTLLVDSESEIQKKLIIKKISK